MRIAFPEIGTGSPCSPKKFKACREDVYRRLTNSRWWSSTAVIWTGLPNTPRRSAPDAPCFCSPNGTSVTMRLSGFCLGSPPEPGWRISLQTHKYIGIPDYCDWPVERPPSPCAATPGFSALGRTWSGADDRSPNAARDGRLMRMLSVRPPETSPKPGAPVVDEVELHISTPPQALATAFSAETNVCHKRSARSW